MSHFEEVLDGVRLALTWASPVEVQALLEGLVEERIISEAYSRSLSLHQLAEGVEPDPACSGTPRETGSDLICSPGSAVHGHLDRGQLSQVRKCGSSESVSSVEEHNAAMPMPKIHPLYDEHYQCSLELDDEMEELLRSAESMQKPASDNERTYEGNLEGEKEWLEQVEEAARRIAVPLWQHWDRGRRMLLPLVPRMTTGCAASEKRHTATNSEARCPALDMEEETELATTCRTLDLYALNFDCTRAEITDAPGGLCLSTCDSSTGDIHRDAGAGLTEAFAHLFSACRPKDAQENSFYSDTDHSVTLGALDDLGDVFRAAHGAETCSSHFHESQEGEERVDSHWGKFELSHRAASRPMSARVYSHLHNLSVWGHRNTATALISWLFEHHRGAERS